jgi:hypothetical protein
MENGIWPSFDTITKSERARAGRALAPGSNLWSCGAACDFGTDLLQRARALPARSLVFVLTQ